MVALDDNVLANWLMLKVPLRKRRFTKDIVATGLSSIKGINTLILAWIKLLIPLARTEAT